MFGLDAPVLGIILATIAIILLGLWRWLLRVAPNLQPLVQTNTLPALADSIDIPDNEDAVLIVQPGGKITYINEKAREWFSLLDEDLPNLEYLARRARPSDTFLNLCATQGQSRFSMQGIIVDGSSTRIPHQGKFVNLISLRQLNLSPLAKEDSVVSGQTLDILTELNQAMSASLNLESTLQSILESIERVIPSDLVEITVWNENLEFLVAYGFTGLPGVDRRLEKTSNQYRSDEGYTGYIFSNKTHLIVSNVDTFREVRPVADRRAFPFKSYLGLALIAGGETVGTIELGSLTPDSFSENDLEVLRILSGQAALALQHALIHEEEERRVAELTGLANLAQTVGDLSDPRNLYAHLVNSIHLLLEVDILGFLIFDETQNRLKGQIPFIGIQEQFIDFYQLEIPPESPAEKIWLSEEAIVAPNAPVDEQLNTLGLSHHAQAAGIQNTVLMPLTLRGRSIGYLQAANKKDSTPFNNDDLRLLAIIAGQTAPIIGNANLVREARRRTKQAEALRRIAGLASSAATLDEILKFSLLELARLLQADVAAILLVNESASELQLHEDSLFGIEKESIIQHARLSMTNPQFRKTTTSSLQVFHTGNVAEGARIAAYYEPLIEVAEVLSAIDIPLVVREHGVGEILIGSKQLDFFQRSDIELASSAAGQIAGAIERSTLYTQTDESLRRKVEQMTSISRISREMNTSLDLQRLLNLIYHEVVYNTSADSGSIVLFDLNGQLSENPDIIFSIGERFDEELLPIERQVYRTERAIIIDNYRSNAEFEPPNQDAGAAMVLPITFQDNIIGLIHLYARTPLRFDQAALEVAQTLATQSAIALINAQRFQEQFQTNKELQTRMDTLSKLVETNQALRHQQTLLESVQTIANGIQESTPFNTVLISLYDDKTDSLNRVGFSGITPDKVQELQQHTVRWTRVQDILKPEFRHKQSYFIPADKLPVVPPDIHTVNIISESGNGHEAHWHPDDMLIAPLLDNKNNPLGLISVDAPRDGLRPDLATIETLEIFASQTALMIEGHQKLSTLSSKLNILQAEVTRTQDATQTAQQHLPTLLRKDLEQTVSLQRLQSRTQQIQAGLEIVQAVNQQTDRETVLHTFASEMVARTGADITMIAEMSERGPVMVQVCGKTPSSTNPQALLGQRNPLQHSLRTGEAILIPNLDAATIEAASWENAPLLHAMQTKSFICLPIMAPGTDAIEAAILSITQEAVPDFAEEDQKVFALLGRQVGVTLQNIKFQQETAQRLGEVNLLLDFSRSLSSLNPAEVIDTLVESALQVIVNANAGKVALWNEKEGKLITRAASGYQNNALIKEITYEAGEALPGQVFVAGEARSVEEVDFARDYNLSSENLLRYQNATDGRVPISSLLIPIQASESTLGVLVLDNFKSLAAFTNEDQSLITSLTQQTGLILENAHLFQAAEQRAGQLQALTDIATTITSNLQVDAIITSLLEQLEKIIPFETATLWHRQDNNLTIRAVSGFEDNEQRYGLTVAIEDSKLLSKMIASGRSITVGNVHEDSRFPTLIEYPLLSWLGIPLLSKGEAVGVIALEKAEADFYTIEHIQAATTFAGQAAVALENAQLFEESIQRTQELNERTQRLDLLNQLSTELSSSLDPEQILQTTLNHLQQAVRSVAASAILFDDSGQARLRAETPKIAARLPLQVQSNPLFEYLKESLGVFIAEDTSKEPMLAPLEDFLNAREGKSLLALPLSVGSNLYGIILLHGMVRFTSGEIDLAKTITNQAAVAVESGSLFEQTQTGLIRLEIRERYQNGVAQAVATLTEHGTSAVSEVLQIMGEASQAGRVYYFEANEDEEGVFWHQTAEWCNAGIPSIIDTPEYQKFYASSLPYWHQQLQEEGRVVGLISEAPAPLRKHMDSKETLSTLALEVPGTISTPGYIGFDENVYERTWREDEIAALQTVASALSSTIARETLFSQVQDALSGTEEQARRLSLLNEMSAQFSRATNVQDVLNISVEKTAQILHAKRVSMALINPDEETFHIFTLLGEVGEIPAGINLPLEGSSIKVALETKKIVINRESQDPKLPDVQSFAVVPLLTHETVLGTLNIGSNRPDAFTQSDENIILQIVSLISATINNKQLLEETQRLTEELEQHVIDRTQELAREHTRTQTLLGIITELSTSLDMDIVLNRTLALLNDIIDAEQATIMLAQPAESSFLRRASLGYTTPAPDGGVETTLKHNEGLAGWVINNRQPALIPDLHVDERWLQIGEEPSTHRSSIAVPLNMGQEVLGALLFFHRQTEHFTEYHLDLLQAAAKQIAVAINNAQLYNLIRDQAERLGVMLRSQQVEASRSRAILEAVADGVLVTDASGTISLFNASAETTLDLSHSDVVGKSLDNFVGLFGKAGQQWTNTIQTWSASPVVDELGTIFSEEITLEDDRVISISLAPVLFLNEFLGTVSIFRDITLQVEIDRLKSEFVATVSHELRTPMTSIKGYTEILLMGAGGALSEQQTNFLSVIKTNAERLNILVNDLLDISRIETGKITLIMEALDLIKMTQEVIEEIQRRGTEEEKPVHIEINAAPNLPRAYGDSERIHQVLANLLSNAYLYTPANGQVVVRLAPCPEKCIRVDVVDSGIGIAPEDQDRVFERFYRGEDPLVLASAGTGLGLSIVQQIVEMHNGKIWLESDGVPGRGSTFSFTIPIYQLEA